MNLFEKEAFVAESSVEFENKSAEDVLRLAVKNFKSLTLACSFGAEDVVLVDMLHKINPDIDIFYLDTNVHFKETYETKDRLEQHYGKKFVQVSPKITLDEQAEQFGEELWKSNANQCCNIRKVDPLTDILKNYDAWITGIRRDQAPTRANSKKVEYDVKFGLIKFNPIASWTSEDVWNYIRENDVIYNPLHDNNYPSIGCTHCTRQVAPGEDPRAGRWAESEKTECGLHK
ncbi:Phosphoadenosine phosphosulfate reductase [compost metagenome]